MSVSEADSAPGPPRVRGRAVAALPPEKLLPDKQPSYVASWIYVFGVLSLTLAGRDHPVRDRSWR